MSLAGSIAEEYVVLRIVAILLNVLNEGQLNQGLHCFMVSAIVLAVRSRRRFRPRKMHGMRFPRRPQQFSARLPENQKKNMTHGTGPPPHLAFTGSSKLCAAWRRKTGTPRAEQWFSLRQTEA